MGNLFGVEELIKQWKENIRAEESSVKSFECTKFSG